ncbi:MAG: DUF3017 domain-containing protein [Propionibacteriaceae bacterium]|jgi:hypothetical protein|nr:DUF3017 domain-containing protein [Propionibacteriaceae bacterium]
MSNPARKSPWQQVKGQWPLATTLLGVFVGVVVVYFEHWRLGSTAVGLSLCWAALWRAVLGNRAGLLCVRNRFFDTLCLAILGVGILVLAWIVPPSRH